MQTSPPTELWQMLAARTGLTLDEGQLVRLSCYLDLLVEANARMNLTRITDRAAAEVQHVGDALTLLPLIPAGTARLADVGSGGGVPGIPLAIALPGVAVTLIESTKKKGAFLREVAGELRLSNITVVDQRAEDVAQRACDTDVRRGPEGDGGLRESFDVVIARAVATMNWLAEWCLPLAKKGGVMLAMKGPKVVEELPLAAKAIRMLGGGEAVVHPVELPGTEHRVIVAIPKILRTDKRYPRLSTATGGKPL